VALKKHADNDVEANIRHALTLMEEPEGDRPTDIVYYQAGWRIGEQLGVSVLEDIPAKLEALGVGKPKLESIEGNKIVVRWYDCLTCSNLPPVGKTLCYLEAGLLAGALKKVLGRAVEVEETRCWGTGEKYCQMEAAVAGAAPDDGNKEVNQWPIPFSEENSRLLINLTFQAVQAVKNSRRARYQRRAEAEEVALEPGERGVLAVGEALFERMPTGLMVADRHGIVVKMNKTCEELLEIETRQPVGRPAVEVIPHSRVQTVLESGRPEIWEARKSQGAGSIVLEIPLFSGTEVVGALSQVFPIDSDLVRLLLQKLSQLEAEVKRYQEELRQVQRTRFRFHPIQSLNRKMQEVLTLAEKTAPSNATVLILGQSGTGKEVLARAIHQESARRNSPFLKVDCASIPQELLESELFGYEEGAFTGAKKGGKPGKFELARGGTIFLDEIGDMTPNMQAKLLRVLQDKEFERLGGTRPIKVDVRIIAATNRDLERLVREGRFREDLFYRLNVVKLVLPPLAERVQDIPLLVDSILERLGKEYGRKPVVTAAAMGWLLRYSWPGNIRELENVLERALLLTEEGRILPEHLPLNLQRGSQPTGPTRLLQEVRLEAEKEAILLALEASRGEKAGAARALGLSRQALYAKMARYGLDRRREMFEKITGRR